MRTLPFLALLLLLAPRLPAASAYPVRLDDPQAVHVSQTEFGALADGLADDTIALQRALDRVQETTRRGIVFLPAGRYRLTRALHVWSGIRLIGTGATRPVLVLGAGTPGFQGPGSACLVHFAGERPSLPGEPIRDANPGTFYSALSNVDIEIGPGNPGAVGVRSSYAQHGFLSHMRFDIGEGLAGIEQVGNEAEDLQFVGGDYGILTNKPSASWPFLLIDSSFEGQRRAAIETQEAGLTLVRIRFSRLPSAIIVREDRAEQLWLEDSRLEDISGPALVVSSEYGARTQINLHQVLCARVPLLARFRESGRTIAAPAPLYRVDEFSHGLHIGSSSSAPKIDTRLDATALSQLPELPATDIAQLPPASTWVNLRSLGAVGDGVHDDTPALRAAIAAHRVLYLPSGRYRVSDTILLRPDTVLIGLNPITTQLLITDRTPAFQGIHAPAAAAPSELPGVPRSFQYLPPFPGRGPPKAVLEAPREGTNIVSGIGIDTGGINNRAVGLLWRAGERSLVNDVRFLGGHGTYGPDGKYLQIYNNNHSGDPDDQRRWDSQHASLWVADGGGGTFKDIWTPSPFAAAGMLVSDTSTPGRVYALSSEHHVRAEVILRRVSNWEFHALQTEAERGESPRGLPVELEDCHRITFSNTFLYRVDMPHPFPTAIRATGSSDLQFRGLHVYSPGKLSYDNTLVEAGTGREFRDREIAWLQVPAASPAPAPIPRVVKIAGGFNAIDGLALDPEGNPCFIDALPARIHRWSVAESRLSLLTDTVPQPVALAFDRSGTLLVVSGHGSVYALRRGASEADIEVLSPGPAAPRPGATAWLPANRWRDGHDWLPASTLVEPLHYVSPDGSAYIPAPAHYPDMAVPRLPWDRRKVDLARAYALLPAQAGSLIYASDEFGQRTWRFRVGDDGSLREPTLLAEEGEAGTAVDAQGRIYVCAGKVLVFAPDGRRLDTLEIPERPSAIAFGGPARDTLFIAARHGLYALKNNAPNPGSSPIK